MSSGTRAPSPDEQPDRQSVASSPTQLDRRGGAEVLGPPEITRALTRIAHEILERNRGADDLVVLGIPTRGLPLAQRLVNRLAQVEPGVDADAIGGSLDVTMYRDDLSHQPTRTIGATHLPAGGIDGKVVVLVDDVLYSGRTIRAALDAISDLGRPRAVRLAVLVDRGHRELPIRADYVGKNLPTAAGERVRVLLAETDGRDAVLIEEPPGGRGASGSGASATGVTR